MIRLWDELRRSPRYHPDSRLSPGTHLAVRLGSDVSSPATARISAARALCTGLVTSLPVSVVAEGASSLPGLSVLGQNMRTAAVDRRHLPATGLQTRC